jgi:hypothetical protein
LVGQKKFHDLRYCTSSKQRLKEGEDYRAFKRKERWLAELRKRGGGGWIWLDARKEKQNGTVRRRAATRGRMKRKEEHHTVKIRGRGARVVGKRRERTREDFGGGFSDLDLGLGLGGEKVG